MAFGTSIYNTEGKLILSTDRRTYQFIGKYSPDYLAIGNFGAGTAIGTTPACLGATLALPTGISNTPSDWMVFFRYATQDVEFSCGPVVAPITQLAIGTSTSVAYTGLTKVSPSSTSNVHSFYSPTSWGAASDLSSFKVGDYMAISYIYGYTTAANPGYATFSTPSAYAYITSITSTFRSGSIGFPVFTITFDRSITVSSNQVLLNITAAQTNRLNVSGYVNYGSNVTLSNCEFYVFCRMNNAAVVPGNQYGMRTYDSSGQCTFDSNRRALNIAARSNSPNFSTLSPPLYAGYNGTSGIYQSNTLPNYSVDVGTIPTNWAIGSSSSLGYYFNRPGSQSYRTNYTYTSTGVTAFCLQLLMPTVDIADKTKLAVRPTLAMWTDSTLSSAGGSGYFLGSVDNNQLTLLINVDQYQ